MKSIAGYVKKDKIAGAGCGNSADWLPKSKVAPFKILFDKIRDHVGSYNGARDFIGIGASSLDGLEKGKISAATGKKILAAYNKIKLAK